MILIHLAKVLHSRRNYDCDYNKACFFMVQMYFRYIDQQFCYYLMSKYLQVSNEILIFAYIYVLKIQLAIIHPVFELCWNQWYYWNQRVILHHLMSSKKFGQIFTYIWIIPGRPDVIYFFCKALLLLCISGKSNLL